MLGAGDAELDTYRDIREYLRKWQKTNPNVLDPVQDIGPELPTEEQQYWAGNMLSVREDGQSGRGSSQLLKNDYLDIPQETEGEHLEPGDLIGRLTPDGVFELAIYVQSVQKQRQFYTSRGNWRICLDREIDYVFKGFVPPELLEPIKPHMPCGLVCASSSFQITLEGGIPRPLGARLLDMMAGFEEDISEFNHYHSKILDDLHGLVADDTDYLRLNLNELTTKVLGIDESQLTTVNLAAVHQAVRRYPFLIEKETTTMFHPVYLVQPKRIAQLVDKVTTWVHEHQEYCIRAVMGRDTPGMKDHPIQKFIQKSQRLIRLSRKLRSPTIMSCVGPSSQKFQPGQDDKPMVYREVLTEKFGPTDQSIIEYLQLYAIPTVIMSSGALRSTASHIMRATGMYNTLGLSDSSTRLFLQELGVISPWENLSLLDQTLLLPGHGLSLIDDMRWEELEETCKDLPLPLTDSMQHLRRDWGDMPVYCVDDVTAQEIDDGVSLERVSGSDDTFWVHIHVANPTAFLSHDNPVMEYAASRIATTYAPERTYPIFPTSLTRDNFSLAAGRPTLTFSAKMNLAGEILDTQVVNGTIHNVISITHGTVRNFFNPGVKDSSEYLTVGGEFVDHPPGSNKDFRETLSTEDQENFTILRKLMLGFREQRQNNGAMDMQNLSSKPSLSLQMGTLPIKPYEMQVTEGRYYVGDPIISLRMRDVDPHEVRDESKDYLISLLMNLAGHIAGQFCATRNIPAVYDGTWYDPEYQRVTRDNMKEFGGQGFYGLVMPRALSSSNPIRHHMLGLDAYVKNTSPLRRFTDVIAHYQIEAALRFEHEHGRPFDASTDVPAPLDEISESPLEAPSSTPTPLTLPFTTPYLDAHIISSLPIRTRLQDVSFYSTRHWACLLLFRAFYFRECDLPSSFPCLLRTPRSVPKRDETIYSGSITNLGVDCVVTIPDDCPDKDRMNIFDVVEARITAVDMATLQVQMEATGMIKPFERTGEWA